MRATKEESNETPVSRIELEMRHKISCCGNFRTSGGFIPIE